MSNTRPEPHPFGKLLEQYRARKPGLTQAKLAARMGYDPSVLAKMCQGKAALTGARGRERVLRMILALRDVDVSLTLDEANALLASAKLPPLFAGNAIEAALITALQAAPPMTNAHAYSPLPAAASPFVGRAQELTAIQRRLSDPQCRLLTLHGPGGIGKSRLALALAQQLAQQTQNVCFVQLASVDSLDAMIGAIAAALNFAFYADVPAQQQLQNYLREKQLLLVLDNFEQLVTDVILLTNILACAPQIKLLVTSQVLLHLQEEWIYPVEGLSLQPGEHDEQVNDADAMQLFMQVARRVRTSFGSERDYANARQICEWVQGMPLGIELATGWLNTLSCEQIARAIRSNLDLLATRLQNIPERHRSIRAVFEHSWQCLTAPEQTALMSLALLNGFDLDAAEQVGGASLGTLAALLEKSLLHTADGSNYQMHKLLRQFAREKLHTLPEVSAEAQHRMRKHYLGFLAKQAPKLNGAEQMQALTDIGAVIDNVRAAWEHAIQQQQLSEIDAAINGLYWFYAMHSRFAEGEAVFTLAMQALQSQQATHPTLYRRVLARLGAFSASAGRYGVAKTLLNEALMLARSDNAPAEVAFVLNRQGNLEHRHGEVRASIAFLEQSLEISEQIQDERGIAQTLFELAMAHGCGLAEWDKSTELLERSLVINRKLKLQHQTAYTLEDLGTCALFLGEYEAAKPYYQESLRMFRELEDWLGYAKALNGLGASITFSDPAQWQTGVQHQAESIVLLRKLGHRRDLSIHLLTISEQLTMAGQHEQARSNIAESLTISTELGDTLIIAYGYIDLGKIAGRCKEFALARQHIQKALLILLDADLLATTKWFLIIWVQIWASENAGHTETSDDERVQYLALLYACLKDQVDHEILGDGEPLRRQLEAELSAERVVAAKALGATLNLDEVIADVLNTHPARVVENATNNLAV